VTRLQVVGEVDTMSTSASDTGRRTANSQSARDRLQTRLSLRQSLDDLASPVFWRDIALEFVLCVFVECCVVLVLSTLRPEMYRPSTTHIGLFAGFLIYAVSEGYGPLTGAPVNPAACWGFFLAGRMSAARSNYRNLSIFYRLVVAF